MFSDQNIESSCKQPTKKKYRREEKFVRCPAAAATRQRVTSSLSILISQTSEILCNGRTTSAVCFIK